MAAAASVEFDPDSIANLVARYRADLGVSKDGADLVAQWDDQKGSRDLAEATNKPKWFDSQINGHPIIRFDGVNDVLDETGGTVSFPIHFFFVVKQLSHASADTLFAGAEDAGNSLRYQQTASTPETRYEMGGGAGTTISPTLNTAFLIHFYANSTTEHWHSLNDGAEVVGNGGTRTLLSGLRLGAEAGPGNFANIEFAEFLYYSAEVAGADLTNLRNYFSTRYSLGF